MSHAVSFDIDRRSPMKKSWSRSGLMVVVIIALFFLFSGIFGNDYSWISIFMNLALSALWLWLIVQIAPSGFFKERKDTTGSLPKESRGASPETGRGSLP